MATEDYSKLKKTVTKTRSENIASWKDISKNIKDGLKSIDGLEAFFNEATTTFKVNAKLASTKTDDWVRVADQIIAKQTELKAAEKAKDKAKVKDLEKDIKDLEKLATAHSTQVSATIDETNALKAKVQDRLQLISGVTP